MSNQPPQSFNPLSTDSALPLMERLLSLGLPLLWLENPAKPNRPTSKGDMPIPVEQRGTLPLQRGWTLDDAISLNGIGGQWCDQDPWGDRPPGYNIGVRTGYVAGCSTNLVVVVLDSPAKREWAQETLPETEIMLQTAAGEHWCYRCPPNRTGSKARVGALAIEVRGTGGIVVGPGSFDGTGYQQREVMPWTPERIDSMPVFDPTWFGSEAIWEGIEDVTVVAGGERKPPVDVDLESRRSQALAYMMTARETPYRRITAISECLSHARALVFGLCIAPEEAARLMYDSEWNLRSRDWDEELHAWGIEELTDKCIDAYVLKFDKPYGYLLIGGEHDVEPYATTAAAAEHEPSIFSPTDGVRRAADIIMRPVDWVWRGYIPEGMITILDGDPGLGKSTITTDIAARVTRGDSLPGSDHATSPGAAVFISFEESPEAVMVPRLVAAGANLELVYIWDLNTTPFDIEGALEKLEEVVRACSARIVFIDPIMAAFPGGANAHKDQDVRRLLSPLAALAERNRVAIVFVRHLNKRLDGGALYRGGGSIGIIGAARCGLMLAKQPKPRSNVDGGDGEPDEDSDEDDEDPVRILAVTKCNVWRIAPSLRLRLVTAPAPAAGIEVAKVVWDGKASMSADDLVTPQWASNGKSRRSSDRDGDEDKSEVSRAKALLLKLLEGKKDGVYAADCYEHLRSQNVSERTGQRASKLLGIKYRRQQGDGARGRWIWSLPSSSGRGDK